MADFVPVGGVREITDKDEIEQVDKLLNTPFREEVEKQGGMASDRDPMYTQPDKTVGPMERLRLESEAETGVETTTLGAIGRLVGDVFFLGDTRKIEQKNALADILKGEWTMPDYAKAGPTPMGTPGGLPVNPPKKKVTFATARPEEVIAMAEFAGLDPDAVRSLADEKIAFRKSIGEPADDNAALMDAAQTLAENELVNRVHVSSRARRTLPGEGGKNKAGFGYSVIGGGVRNLPYAGQFMLGSAVAGPAGLVLPLLAAYDRRYNANRESAYLIDPGTGGVKETKAGLGADEAVVPSMLGAIGEVGVETLGGKVFDMVGKRLLGGLISKLGGERLMKNSSSIRTIVKSFEDIAKVTRTHSYPAEIVEEWQQELLDAAIESTAEYRGSGDLNVRLQKANKKFGENFGEIVLSMILTQGGQAAIAAGKSTGTISRERKAEQEAASRLRAIGVDEETVKNLLADRDARSVIEYISNLSPEAAESAMKRISARSVKAAEEIKKTAEWMDSLGDKGATSRFVAPSPADMIPGEDGISRYVDPATDTEITYDRVNKEVGVRNGKTGRYAFVSDGPVGERMQRAFAVADTFDKEAQGRDIVNEKKRETLARVLEAKGVDGTYVIVNNVEELAAQNLSKTAEAAYENLDEMGKLPQAFVDTGDVEGAEPVTYFVLDHIRLGEGPGAIAKAMQNIVDAATHEPVHLTAKSPKAAAAFRQMYDKADERLRLEIISEGIRRERGKAAVKQILDENSASADDTPKTADAKDENLRRWFEEGIAYLNEGTITEQSTGVQRTARKVRDFFKADIKTLTDIGVLTERAMRDAKGTVIVRRGNEPRVISGQEADTAEDAVEETVRQAETAKETAPVEEAVPEAPEGAEPPPVEDRAATSADTERTVAKLSGAERKTESGETFYHGGLPKGATLDNVDLDRSGTQQNKNGRSYGGFYLTDASSKAWSEKYASRRSGVLHALRFKPGSSVFTTRANIDRLSADQRAALKAAGYAAIEGKDTLGRNQVVLLDKTAVESFAEEPETLAVAPASVEEVDGVFKAVPAPVTATTPEEAIAPTPVAQESEKGPQVPPAKNESRPQAVARIKKAFAAREPVPVADIEKYGLEVPDTYGLKDGAYVFTPAVGNGGGTQAQPTQDQGDKKTERDRKETRKQALRDLAEAYGDEIWKDGVANGDFAGDGELNIDDQGNVLLTRHADSFGGLTKKGSTMTREELRNVALGGGTYGGSSVNTSAMLGWGEKSWAAAEMTAGEEGRYTGVFKIPKAVLEQMLRDGDAALAGINHGEVILRPEVAEKWLYSVNGKPFSPQISMAQEETETTQEEPAQPPAKKLTRPQRVAAIKKAFKEGEPVSVDEIDALSMNIPDTYARRGDKYVKLAGVSAKEQEVLVRPLTDAQRSFGEELAKKYGAPVKAIKGATEPYESVARFGNMLEKAADKTTDADELSKIFDQSKVLGQESRIVWAILNNPHTSAEVYAMAKKNEAVRAMTSEENIARLDIRRKELREQRGLDKQPSERGVPAEASLPNAEYGRRWDAMSPQERSIVTTEGGVYGKRSWALKEWGELSSETRDELVRYMEARDARRRNKASSQQSKEQKPAETPEEAVAPVSTPAEPEKGTEETSTISSKPEKKETIDEAGKLERMTPEEQMRAIGLYGKDGKANMAHPLAARMLTGKMRSIPVGELITVRGKPDTLTKRWLELNGYTLQGDRYVAPQNGTQAAETPAKAAKAVGALKHYPQLETEFEKDRFDWILKEKRSGAVIARGKTRKDALELAERTLLWQQSWNKEYKSVFEMVDDFLKEKKIDKPPYGLTYKYKPTKQETLELFKLRREQLKEEIEAENKRASSVGALPSNQYDLEFLDKLNARISELEQPTTKKEATDAKSIRSDEGQVRAGGEKGQPEVQRGAEQGSGDLQRQAPEAPRGEQGTVKTVYGDMSSGPLVPLETLKVGDYFIEKDAHFGFYGKEVEKVLGFEDDGRIYAEKSHGGRLTYDAGSEGYKINIPDVPEEFKGIEKRQKDFESFYELIGFQGFEPFSKNHPDIVPSFKDVPPGSKIVTVGNRRNGNAAPMYAITPTGEVYVWQSGYQSGGLTPWRFEGWSKWHKGERPGAMVGNANQSPLQREHAKLKKSHPTGVLAVHLGDFVEFFEDDALIASEVLGVKMDTRNGVRMTGVPYHAINSSVEKLTTAGQDVHMVDYDERARERFVTETIPANTKPTPPDDGGKKPISPSVRERETQARQEVTPSSDVSGRMGSVIEKAGKPEISEKAEPGDTIEVELGGRTWKERVLKVLPDGQAEIDVFGRKYIPFGKYKILERKRKPVLAPVVKVPSYVSPPVEDIFTKAEIESLEKAKLPNDWKIERIPYDKNFDSYATDTKGREWILSVKPSERTVTLKKGPDEYVFNVKPSTPSPDDGGKKPAHKSFPSPTIPKGAKVVTTYDDKGVSYSGEFVRDNGDGTSLIRAFGERPKKGLFRRYGVGRDGVQTVKDIAVSNDKVKMTEPPADLSKLTPAQRTALRRAASAQESVMDTEIAAGETANADVVADMAAIEERGERKRTDNEIMFRVVEDDSLLTKLEEGKKIKVYRAMQLIDGKLYPPMSAKVEGRLRAASELGRWEQSVEQPELVRDGKFVLDKANKSSVPARYNPYFHTSRSPLNDQFSSAYKRPNLVTVEVEVPESELTSGYKAVGAKDSVGEMSWHSGPVSSKLPKSKARKVILSRFAKPIRIVPDSEVAETIANLLKGENISVPENVVTPSLKVELEKRGVIIAPLNNDIPFRVTPQEDAEYISAVESGDMAKAQKMVDDAAKKAGYERETFRGDSMPEEIFVYEPRKRREVGIFTTPLREIADVYAEGGRFSNTSRRFYVRAPKVLDLTKDTVENERWVNKWGESFDEWIDRQIGEEVSAWYILQDGRMFDYEGDWSTERWGDLQATAESEGYDAVILPDYDGSLGVFPSLVVFDSNNLKLADPVTYDDQGNIVPLSKRFDEGTPDIRFRVDQTETPEFKSWFGDSKVVNRRGNPRIMYHGTENTDFTAFDLAYTQGQLGFHFGTKGQAENIYGDEEPDRIIPVYLSIKNPLRLEDKGGWQGEDVVEMVNEAIGSKLSPSASDTAIRRAIIKAGYDGVVYLNEFETPPEESGKNNDSYIAFFPSQIKSATDNVGTFDPTNPDIRFRVDQNEEQDRVESARKTFRELVALMENNPADFRLAQGEPQTRIDKPVIFDKQDLQRVAKVVTGSPLQTFASVSQSGEMNEAMATFNEYEVRSIIDRVVLENRPVENNDTVAKIRIFLQARLEDAAQADDDLAAAMRKKDTARQYAIVDTKDALLRDLDQASRALDLIGSERGRQLAFLKTGLDRNLSVVYRVSMIRKITGRMVTVEEYDKIVERVKEDRKRMKELAANHEKVRLEEARKFREATETARAEAEKKALDAYRRGVAEERANFAFVQNDADADFARRVDPSAGYEGFNTDEIAFRIDDTADGRNKGTYPGALRDLARSVFTQVKAEGGGTVTFARRMFEQGRAKGFDGKLIDRYVYDFNKRLGISILQDAPAALPPRSPSGNAAKIKNADARRTAQVKEAVRRAVAEDMEADGGKIAKRAIEILDKDQSEWAYLSPEDVMSIVTGYPAELEADTRDELEKRYSMIRNHMRTIQRIEEMKRGKYPTPMTLGNDAPDVTLRQLAREMRDMMNAFEFKPGETDPRMVNAQMALRNRLRYSIEELEKSVKFTKQPINEKVSRAIEETPEIRDLRNTLAVLREAYEALPAVEEIREARDTERARRAANNRYHFWNKRLEDAKNGVFPETFKGTETADKDAEIASYRAKAEAARKEYWEIKKSSPQERLAAVTAKVTKAEERLASLEKDLAQTPVADPRAKKPAEMPPASPEEAAKRERLEELRTAISNVRKNILAKWRDENAEAIERAREADRFQFLVAKAKEIERKIKARDFTKTPKRPRVWSARIAIEDDKVRAGLRAINEHILWEANNAAGWTGKAKNAYTWSGNAYRFFKASMDVSNLGVQSPRLFSAHPIVGTKIMLNAIEHAGNDERMAEFMSQLHNDPTYDIAYEAGLALDQQFDDVFGTGMGETFFRKLAEYKEGQGLGREVVSGAAGIALASQRVFDMYGRAMRFHVFKSIVNDPAHANLTKPQLRAIANMVNIMGGVGNTRVYSHGWSSVLSELMWSSRLFTSQWQTLAGGGGILWNAGLGPEGSKQALGREWWQTAAPGALKLYARSLAGNMALSQLFGAIGMMLGDRQPWEDDETFFWKAWDFLFGRRVIGSKNIDVTGGLTSYIALLRRVVDRSHVSMSGKTVPDDDWRAWAATTANFFRGRLRPDLALVISMVFGEDVTGEPFGPRGGIKGTANAFFEATLPITPREMIATVGDMWNTHGVIGVTAGLIPALASDLFGFSKSTAPRDPRYEINRHKSRIGQVRKALEAGKESGDYTEYMRLRDVYAFDVGVSDSVSKLESSANKAKKIADNEKFAADYREEARQAEKWHLDKAREILRGQR